MKLEKQKIDITNIKTEALEEDYELVIGANGFEEYIVDKKLKKKILDLIEDYEREKNS